MAADLDQLVVDQKALVAGNHRAGEPAVHGVVFEQMGQLGVVGPGVYRRQGDVRIVGQKPGQVSADAAESVDADGNRHMGVLLGSSACRMLETAAPRPGASADGWRPVRERGA